MGDGTLFLISLLDCTSLLGLSVYILITLSDLECDYINAANCCIKLNRLVLPELILHGLITIAMLYNWHTILFIILLLPFMYLFNRFLSIPPGNIGLYDPTEIHNRSILKQNLREAMIKLFFYLAFFFVCLYSLIFSLIAS